MATSQRYYRLQYRFIAFFILVALPPLIFLGLVALWSVTKTRAVNVAELELQLARNTAERIEKFVIDRVEGLELRVPDRTLSDLSLVPENQQLLLLEQYLALDEFRGVEAIAMVDATGRELRKIRRDKRPTTLGSIAASDAFATAGRAKRYFGPVYFENGVPLMQIAARIVNGDEFFIGVLTATMNLSFIHDDIARTVMLGESGYLYVVHTEGGILGHSREQKNVGTHAVAPIVQSVLAGTLHTGRGNEDRYATTSGTIVRAAGVFLPTLRLGVIVEWPESEAFAVVRTIQRQIVLFVLSTFGLILLASLFLARQVTKPINDLREGAAIIGSGKFDHRVDLNRHDELQELGESLNTMAVNLQQLDAMKTIQIRNTMLAETLKKEQELSHHKDTFISVMSHQLRTPLTSLQWSMEFLLGEIAKPELHKYVDFINDGAESSKQVTMIVDDLLTVSELGIGYRVANPEMVDCTKLIRKIGIELAKVAEAKHLTLTIDAPETPVLVEGSSLNLHKVFLNLLDNALTYTEKGGVTVHAKEEGDRFITTITDTGIGIPKDEQKDVFREFFRAKNAIVGKNVGTGLGLFIVRTIVQGHSGTVVFTSEEGKGTTFTVTLPKQQQKA